MAEDGHRLRRAFRRQVVATSRLRLNHGGFVMWPQPITLQGSPATPEDFGQGWRGSQVPVVAAMRRILSVRLIERPMRDASNRCCRNVCVVIHGLNRRSKSRSNTGVRS